MQQNPKLWILSSLLSQNGWLHALEPSLISKMWSLTQWHQSPENLRECSLPCFSLGLLTRTPGKGIQQALHHQAFQAIPAWVKFEKRCSKLKFNSRWSHLHASSADSILQMPSPTLTSNTLPLGADAEDLSRARVSKMRAGPSAPAPSKPVYSVTSPVLIFDPGVNDN